MSSTKKDLMKPGTKELDVCHDCAEYGGHFCDECLEEIIKIKNQTGLDGGVPYKFGIDNNKTS